MTPVDHKERAFEDKIEAALLEAGWLDAVPGGFDAKLGLYPDEVFSYVRDTQPEAWQRIVQLRGGSEADAERGFLERLAQTIDRDGTVTVLRQGVEDRGVRIVMLQTRPAHGLVEDAQRLYDANRTTVVRQFKYNAETDEEIDLALLVNGIPVATAELKNPLTGQGVQKAKLQYMRDRDPANLTLAVRCVVHFAVDPNEVWMTTKLARRKTRFLPFNRGSAPDGTGGAGNYDDEAGSYRTAYLWRDVWQRDAFLEILARFYHVEGKGPSAARIFPRFHQWDVVTRLAHDARSNGAGKSYLIQHSAGSGKSNSIAWLAHGLSSLHAGDDLVFDKTIVVTDRVVLDQQLQDTIYQFEHKHGLVEKIDKDKTSKDVLDALKNPTARIIITTIQKFPFVLEKLEESDEELEAGKKYAVIMDEAHSSQSGDTAAALALVVGEFQPSGDHLRVPNAPEDDPLAAEALAQEVKEDEAEAAGAASSIDAIAARVAKRGRPSNVSYFGFTATPKARTLELFGEKAPDGTKRPFHLYSMRQAIDEGFILDVLTGYTTYDTYYRLQHTGPETGEADKRRASAELARFAQLHPWHLRQKAEVIVEHFREHVRRQLEGKAKAMVVSSSRLHAVRYKQTIDKYIADKGYSDLKTLVAFSGEVTDPQTHERFTEPGMNEFGEKELPKKFRSDEYQVLIVAEKYQTGFDQPLLAAMYVDKRLKNVAAVQTLSRLNRTYVSPSGVRKDKTFVLDFVNTTDEIEEAFAPYYEQTTAEASDPNIVFDAYKELWKLDVLRAEEVERYATVYYTSKGSKDHDKLYVLTRPAVDRFEALADEDKDAFRQSAQKYQRIYSFLSQVVTWITREQEALYVFVKALLPQIPPEGRSASGIDVSTVELSHFRLEMTSDEGIDLSGGTDPLSAFRGDGTGSQSGPQLDTIEEIIKRFNETYGINLTEADRVLAHDHNVARLLEDDRVVSQARSNDRDTFKMAAADDFIRVFLGTRQISEDLFLKVMQHADLKDALMNSVLDAVYDKARD